jgi:dipeptidase
MCDTFVALAPATADGSVVLGKNSDREPNEAHEVVLVPAADHEPGTTVTTTYLRIPQAPHTHGVLLAKPYWIWGAEMGVNSFGVAIGNEAVFTRIPHEAVDGLIGMDLLRLALERSRTADEAVHVITDLLERYGQSGQCGHTHDLRYHNSFIVADSAQAWVLETAGREWAASRLQRYGSISNALTHHRDADLSSPGLVDEAVRRGWCTGPDDFDFAADYSDRIYTRFSDARPRQCRTEGVLASAAGMVTPALAMQLLRDHGDRGAAADWTPARGLLGQDVCAHAGFGPVRVSQSVGSMVAHLVPDEPPSVWVTGTSAPCTSVFKPVWFDGGLPDLGPTPTGTYDSAALWWRHEDLHRASLAHYPDAIATYATERDRMEADLLERADKARAGSSEDRATLTTQAFAEADAAERRWLAQLPAGRRPTRGLYGRAWAGFDRAAART